MKNAETLEFLPLMSTSVNQVSAVNDQMDLKLSAQCINKNFLKRTIDILLSLFLLIFFFSWIFPLVCLAILIDTGLPVFFIQDRIGKNGQRFKFIKFRTMVRHADENKFIPTQVGDKRITKTGKFLRNTNIDELPQFMNILKGDMSIVGPRPAAIAFHQKYIDMLGTSFFCQREIVRPGIIGLSQILGYRGDHMNEQENRAMIKARIKIDLLYIRNWNNWLDLKISIATFRNLIRRIFGS
ncbi:MAG: sugar transferase [Chitinophagaceae bacterium]